MLSASGDSRLDPVVTAVAMRWLRSTGLAEWFAPAKRWLAAFWSFAVDDQRLHEWCRKALVGLPGPATMIEAIVFDLDGVLVDTEPAWAAVREELVRETGGQWHERASVDMMGMSSLEWSAYMHDQLAVPLGPAKISEEVVRRLARRYEAGVPLLPGGARAVAELAAHWPLALASSANRPVIDLVLDRTGLRRYFRVTVSSEEVSKGKPAPDVYLAATEGLETDPRSCVAIEDSTNGIESAKAAGLFVVAVPNRAFPPTPGTLARADAVISSLEDLDSSTFLSLSG